MFSKQVSRQCMSIFFFNDTATTEIYTLSLHDALPICRSARTACLPAARGPGPRARQRCPVGDRKSTRLNSSHLVISYAVFCLKKKNVFSRRPTKTNTRPQSQTALLRHAENRPHKLHMH